LIGWKFYSNADQVQFDHETLDLTVPTGPGSGK